MHHLTLEEWRAREQTLTRQRWLKRLAILAIILLIIFIEPPLVGSKWELQSINGDPVLASQIPITAEFRFLILIPAMRATTGCNYTEAFYLRIGPVLKLFNGAVTDVLCDTPAQEREILDIYRDALFYDVRDGLLIIKTTDGRQLTFRRQ